MLITRMLGWSHDGNTTWEGGKVVPGYVYGYMALGTLEWSGETNTVSLASNGPISSRHSCELEVFGMLFARIPGAMITWRQNCRVAG